MVLVAGATGNLGGRIVKALLAKKAEVRVLVRPTTDQEKIQAWENQGVSVIKLEMTNAEQLKQALREVTCVVSALQGLEDVIVEAQLLLLHAAVSAGVPRFIPSDFSSDFTQIPAGDNRNFDLRRQFHRHLDQAAIASTSIFNGAFTDILAYNTPLLDLQNNSISYWEDANWPIDFTTMDNTAEFTAAAALDEATPEKLVIASFRITPTELKELAEKTTGRDFTIQRMGSRAELTVSIRQNRAEHPEGEKELYPQWQQMQYLLSMFSAQAVDLANDRYTGIHWTPASAILSAMALNVPFTSIK
ncbi:MAG: Isoflavone reductase homolog P3 [uncultured Adhaeribacter sp.]|uniref:Isoflavone reductase homolog P3 n=1 Tax=uncultured Adhaeribacter sp. TaxID=448109 RepID=A0A6J4J7L1_9BACT|nr:MAG: Isoflavone reductase homolog P3 [uncultured Adhaeribacter sp.]